MTYPDEKIAQELDAEYGNTAFAEGGTLLGELRGTAILTLHPEHYILTLKCKIVDRFEGKVPRYDVHLDDVMHGSSVFRHTGITDVQAYELLTRVEAPPLNLSNATLRRILNDMCRTAGVLAS